MVSDIHHHVRLVWQTRVGILLRAHRGNQWPGEKQRAPDQQHGRKTGAEAEGGRKEMRRSAHESWLRNVAHEANAIAARAAFQPRKSKCRIFPSNEEAAERHGIRGFSRSKRAMVIS